MRNSKILKRYKPKPLIGFEGIGSQLTILNRPNLIVIRSSMKSQLKLVTMLFLIGPGILALTYTQWTVISHKPVFILIVLFLVALIGCVTFAQKLLNLVSRKRLEINKKIKSIELMVWRNTVLQNVKIESGDKFEVHTHEYLSGRTLVPNFTLQLKKNSLVIDLITVHKEKSITHLKNSLEDLCHRKS